jgi:glucosylceramidase
VHDAHPDKDTWFTECSGGAWAPNFGDNLKWNVRTLIVGATRHWARGVMLWNLALDERHGPHAGGCNDCRGVVTIDSATGAVTRNEEYYALAHASRFVRPGAVRIASSSGVNDIETVAFRNREPSPSTRRMWRTRSRSRQRGRFVTLPAGAVATYRWR